MPEIISKEEHNKIKHEFIFSKRKEGKKGKRKRKEGRKARKVRKERQKDRKKKVK